MHRTIGCEDKACRRYHASIKYPVPYAYKNDRYPNKILRQIKSDSISYRRNTSYVSIQNTPPQLRKQFGIYEQHKTVSQQKKQQTNRNRNNQRWGSAYVLDRGDHVTQEDLLHREENITFEYFDDHLNDNTIDDLEYRNKENTPRVDDKKINKPSKKSKFLCQNRLSSSTDALHKLRCRRNIPALNRQILWSRDAQSHASTESDSVKVLFSRQANWTSKQPAKIYYDDEKMMHLQKNYFQNGYSENSGNRFQMATYYNNCQISKSGRTARQHVKIKTNSDLTKMPLLTSECNSQYLSKSSFDVKPKSKKIQELKISQRKLPNINHQREHRAIHYKHNNNSVKSSSIERSARMKKGTFVCQSILHKCYTLAKYGLVGMLGLLWLPCLIFGYMGALLVDFTLKPEHNSLQNLSHNFFRRVYYFLILNTDISVSHDMRNQKNKCVKNARKKTKAVFQRIAHRDNNSKTVRNIEYQIFGKDKSSECYDSQRFNLRKVNTISSYSRLCKQPDIHFKNFQSLERTPQSTIYAFKPDSLKPVVLPVKCKIKRMENVKKTTKIKGSEDKVEKSAGIRSNIKKGIRQDKSQINGESKKGLLKTKDNTTDKNEPLEHMLKEKTQDNFLGKKQKKNTKKMLGCDYRYTVLRFDKSFRSYRNYDTHLCLDKKKFKTKKQNDDCDDQKLKDTKNSTKKNKPYDIIDAALDRATLNKNKSSKDRDGDDNNKKVQGDQKSVRNKKTSPRNRLRTRDNTFKTSENNHENLKQRKDLKDPDSQCGVAKHSKKTRRLQNKKVKNDVIDVAGDRATLNKNKTCQDRDGDDNNKNVKGNQKNIRSKKTKKKNRLKDPENQHGVARCIERNTSRLQKKKGKNETSGIRISNRIRDDTRSHRGRGKRSSKVRDRSTQKRCVGNRMELPITTKTEYVCGRAVERKIKPRRCLLMDLIDDMINTLKACLHGCLYALASAVWLPCMFCGYLCAQFCCKIL